MQKNIDNFGVRLTQAGPLLMSALPPKADIGTQSWNVRFVPIADIQAAFGYYCWWARVLKFVERHP